MRHPENETELSLLPNIYLLKLDISDKVQIADAIEKAEKISPVDLLFNNAGYGFAEPLEAASDEQFERLICTDYFGTVLVTKAFLP